MRSIKITTDDIGIKLMEDAAAYMQVPLSIWVRMVAMNEARACAHRILCATPKDRRSQKQKLYDAVNAQIAEANNSEDEEQKRHNSRESMEG